MTTATTARPVGLLLREWRERRHLSQLVLASAASISTRHLSYVETGRSRPTAPMVLRLAEHLDVPLRERNSLLLAAGHAPEYTGHEYVSAPMAAVHDAIERILAAHAPYPALVVDRGWDMVAGNDAVMALTVGVAAHLLEPPVNVLRLSLHPDGLAPRIVNLAEWSANLRHRLAHEVRTTADPELAALLRELESYPAGGGAAVSDAIVVPLRLRVPGGELSMISTTTVFGTPRDVTVAELAIESFYPADDATARALRGVETPTRQR